MVLPRSDSVVEMATPRIADVAQRMTPVLFDNAMEAPLILVVDDHPTNRELLARQIKLLGLRIRTAENGRVGVSLWRDGCFAMVISDCHMPDMDGYEMTRTIRKIEFQEGRPRTPVIAWTANALSEERERIEAAGMDELLVKPVNLAQLRVMLVKWLKPEESVAEVLHETHSLPTTQSPIDYSLLDMIVADRAEQKQLLRDFIAHIRGDRIKLGEVQEDRAFMQSVAHRMKGSCNMIGAVLLGSLCAEIEQAARQGELIAAQSRMGALDAAIEQLDEFLA
jgi:CheY-like chemotaxis protein